MSTTIQVSGCRFITDPSTWVGDSTFFKALFSGQWGDKQDDGSYFIDADADLFKYILYYLRCGLLPVFYDRTDGHNHVLYSTLLEEARFFGIDRLEKWLSEKKYLEALKIVHSVVGTDKLNKLATTVNGDVEIVCHPTWKKIRVYYCPDERLQFYEIESNPNGKMTLLDYRDQILKPIVKPWIQRGEDFVLEEDGDSGHGTSKNNIVRKWKEENGLESCFNHPSSPDLAPIENCWQPTKDERRKYPHWDEPTTRSSYTKPGEIRLPNNSLIGALEACPGRLKDVRDSGGQFAAQEWIIDDIDENTYYRYL